MKTLIEKTSLLYLKRLCRELNALPDGFYYTGGDFNVRCTKAAIKGGFLSVIPCGNRGFRAMPSDTQFIDAYGRAVIASRKAL